MNQHVFPRALAVIALCLFAGLCFWPAAVTRPTLQTLSVTRPERAQARAAALPKLGHPRHPSLWPRTPAEARESEQESDNVASGYEFMFKIRAFPHQHIPHGARARAIEQANRLRLPREVLAQTLGTLADSSQHWTSIGPQPIQGGWAGRVTALAVDPHDNNTVYLGGAEGGVWKTTDGGGHWLPMTDFEPALAIGSLAIDPSNSKVIYAGTGEANFNFDSFNGMGILKSTDGGKTWSLLAGKLFDQQSIGALAISPTNTSVILAAASQGLYRSADGGQTWQTMMTGTATAALFDPKKAGVAYAATVFSDQVGIYKSVDSGQTWKLSNGSAGKAIKFPSDTFRITLALSPSNGTLYTGYDVSTSSSSPLAGFFTSADGGGTWTQIPGQAYCTNQCWYNNVLAVSPTNPKLLIGGGVKLATSFDGGGSWQLFNVHVDQHAVAFTPDGSRVYVGNDGGVWSAATATPFLNWANLNATLALTQFYGGLSVEPGNPAVSFGGTQDNGSLFFSGSQWAADGCGDGAATAIDPVTPQTVYIACAGLPSPTGVVQRSTAGGVPGTFMNRNTGISAAEGVPFLPYLTIDPTNPQNLYFTGNEHIYQSTNGGGFWTAISPSITFGFLPPCAIVVAPGDSNTVYAGSCDGVAKVTHSALSGTSASWSDISNGLPGTAITHFTVDPGSALKAYVTLSGFQNGHVFFTQDGGHTWKDISGNLPDISANDLVIDPDVPGTLYVGTDTGVYWTNTSGKFWSALGAGLPQVAVLSLAMEHTTRTLRAATHGRSVWDLLMPTEGLNLIPSITALTPATVALHSANPALNVTGANFAASSMVLVNGQSRAATLVSGSKITATLTAEDVATDALLAVSVYTPGPGGGMSAVSYVKVGPNPAIYPGGVVNAANAGAAAPGAIVSVYGVNFAPQPALSDKVPLPLNLAGASLTVADANAGFSGSAPLFYVSGGQMNVQIPWEVQPDDTAVMTPVLNGAQGAPLNVDIKSFAPGIFTVDESGNGQGAVTNALTGQLAAPAGKYPNSQPVKRGDFLSIYCTGLGQVDHPPADGAPASSEPLSNTFLQPLVLIGNSVVAPSFSGLAPGYIGLYQVNVQVPQDASTGDTVKLSISDGFGGISNTVTVAIQ